MLTGDLEVDAMVEDVLGRAEIALIRSINIGIDKVYEQAEIHVPKSGQHQTRPNDPSYPQEPLEKSGEVRYATPGDPTASVTYDSPYAAAQEVGEMTYHRGEKEVHWVAENYTTSGTGSRFLSNALKTVGAEMEVEVAAQSRISFGELSGPVNSKSTIRTSALQEERMPPPTGQMAQALRQQQSRVDQSAASSFIIPSAPPITQ